MARVFRRPGDECWWLDYSVDGRRYRVKTNTKSRRVAEDLLAEKRADITRVKLGLEVADGGCVRCARQLAAELAGPRAPHRRRRCSTPRCASPAQAPGRGGVARLLLARARRPRERVELRKVAKKARAA